MERRAKLWPALLLLVVVGVAEAHLGGDGGGGGSSHGQGGAGGLSMPARRRITWQKGRVWVGRSDFMPQQKTHREAALAVTSTKGQRKAIPQCLVRRSG